ncbi:DUF6457 domain-containing protein [Propioniferax innocua]|uniref:DUF6457 domain-containing protein n=1 Tax=Propioniferax innocua TaxID=1753 RepID=A0A542ZRF9_9ACTN|nr:DUF6457 domain-containing protein [Propioniferax innocua]TQL62944.1 hypothetical protein FB460_0736 [Propioniferax innocua]
MGGYSTLGVAMADRTTRDDLHEWDRWLHAGCAEVGVDPDLVDVELIHDLSREIAHSGMRPMVPVSAFILGLCVARGEDAHEVAGRLQRIGV